jgi:hypothetical protein
MLSFFFPPLNIYKFCYRIDGIEVYTYSIELFEGRDAFVAFLFKEL